MAETGGGEATKLKEGRSISHTFKVLKTKYSRLQDIHSADEKRNTSHGGVCSTTQVTGQRQQGQRCYRRDRRRDLKQQCMWHEKLMVVRMRDDNDNLYFYG